jgi:hypothetical protein
VIFNFNPVPSQRIGANVMSEQRPTYHATPAALDVREILASPSTSFWLKDALLSALQRDPIDAANDAEVLASVLASRCHSSASL